MIAENLDKLKTDFDSELASVENLKQLEDVRIKYLSRNGLLAELFDSLKDAPKEKKPLLGKSLNALRNDLTEKFNNLKNSLESSESSSENRIDLTLLGIERQIGSKHVLTQTLDEIKNIFKGMGFSVFEGPELESDYYNFEALNFPADHPARDMQDTFFINKDFLLRTHT